MRRIFWVLLGTALGAGCGDEKTTAHCGAACDVWATCGWDRAACVSECEADGDWDQAYLDCLEANQANCQALVDVCG